MVSKIIIYSVVLALAIITIGILAINWNSTANTQGSAYITQTPTQSTAPPTTNTSATLFANTQYAQFAYLISSPTISSQAQAALAGFSVSRVPSSNGSVTMTITLLADGSKQSVVLQPGYKLYIIETSFGDDSFGGESNLGDDGFVMVNQNGYVA